MVSLLCSRLHGPQRILLIFFTYSAGGKQSGFGIYFQGRWEQTNWPNEWAENGTLADITFLEPFPVVVAISIWGLHLRNKKLTRLNLRNYTPTCKRGYTAVTMSVCCPFVYKQFGPYLSQLLLGGIISYLIHSFDLMS